METSDKLWKVIYKIGAITTIIVLSGIVLDMIAGSITGGNLATSYIGIIGNSLMVIYIVLVTFVPTVESLALAFAMPAGLLVMTWMIMVTIKFFKLCHTE